MIDISKLSKEIERYEDRWIAIDKSEEKVVGVGDNALETTADAERNGYQDTLLFKSASVRFCLHPTGLFEIASAIIVLIWRHDLVLQKRRHRRYFQRQKHQSSTYNLS